MRLFIQISSTVLLFISGSAFADSSGTCTVTTKCKIGSATCSAGTSNHSGAKSECKPSEDNVALQCQFWMQNADGSSYLYMNNYVCCTKDGTALSTRSAAEAKKSCAGYEVL